MRKGFYFLLVVVGVTMASPVVAWDWLGLGCWKCVSDGGGLYPGQVCEEVLTDGGTGTGTDCAQEHFLTWVCVTQGTACVNVDSGGGGGAGGGGWGGGGGSCTIGLMELCPASCFNCVRTRY